MCCRVTNYPQIQPLQRQACVTSRVLCFWLRLSHSTATELSTGTAVTSGLDSGGTPSKLTHLHVDGIQFLLSLGSPVLGGCWQETCLIASECSLPYMTARTVVPVSVRARKGESKPQRTSEKEARGFLILCIDSVWLCRVCIATRRLSPAAVGTILPCGSFQAQALEPGLGSCDAQLCCSTACGIFPDQGPNPCLRHWQVAS